MQIIMCQFIENDIYTLYNTAYNIYIIFVLCFRFINLFVCIELHRVYPKDKGVLTWTNPS